MISCKEVARLVASDEYEEAGWMTRLAVRAHLLMCAECRFYVAQIQAIGKTARSLLTDRRDSGELVIIQRLENAILKDIRQ